MFRLVMYRLAFMTLLSLAVSKTYAQEVKAVKEEETSKEAISTSGEKLIKKFEVNDDRELALGYEELARKFIDKENFTKAEEYLKKALRQFRALNSRDDIARVSRQLAKVQEKLNKRTQAVVSYSTASANSAALSDKEANQYDASRNVSFSDVATQSNSIDANIAIFRREGKSQELQDAYSQKVTLYLMQNDYLNAINTCKNAIADAGDNEKLIIQWKDRLADIHLSLLHYDEAIKLHNELLDAAVKSGNVPVQISQLRRIGDVHIAKNDPATGLPFLRSSYRLAQKSSNSAEVRLIMAKLLDQYKKSGAEQEIVALYDDFYRNFDRLVRSDSSLIDMSNFQVIEEKIKQLEAEKKLKDQLIKSTNTFNYFLIGSLLILMVLLGLFIRSLLSIKKRNKRIALQSLRREMNPHFIFNSLNSVNQFISQNNELEANKYLSSYSNLMRNTMVNSNRDFILMANEVELLRKYLDLELMRFSEKFDFSISMDEELDPEALYIPNMLIQPNLENAIWHGLRYRDEKGMLKLDFKVENKQIRVTIDDNGIGVAKSKELKTANQKVYESLGLKNTQARIDLLNSLYKKDISFSLTEKAETEQGTLVELTFPLIDKLPE